MKYFSFDWAPGKLGWVWVADPSITPPALELPIGNAVEAVEREYIGIDFDSLIVRSLTIVSEPLWAL